MGGDGDSAGLLEGGQPERAWPRSDEGEGQAVSVARIEADPPQVRKHGPQKPGAKFTIQPAQLRVIVERERSDLDEAILRSVERPKTRGDCASGPRPCPWVSCRHHLMLEANSTGSITFPLGEIEIDEMGETCSLDIADRGGTTLEEVGATMAITRERARQIEVRALRRAGAHPELIQAAGGDPIDWPTHRGPRAASE